MRVLIKEKLSEHKYKTPEGYLICTDAILARTGKQTYRRDEIFHDSDDTEVEVDRTAEEVFSPQTLASFENKPITVEHPDEDVNSENYKDYAVGFVRDVHQGKADGQDVILGTLVIQDAQTIEEIENGEHVELSCGYDCDIDDSENPQQRNIRGNHVALCECGRAGNARIVDSQKVKDVKYFAVSRYDSAKYNNINSALSDLINFGEDDEVKLYSLKNEKDVQNLYSEDLIGIYKNGKLIEKGPAFTKRFNADSVKDVKYFAIKVGQSYIWKLGKREGVKVCGDESDMALRFRKKSDAESWLDFIEYHGFRNPYIVELNDSIKDANRKLEDSELIIPMYKARENLPDIDEDLHWYNSRYGSLEFTKNDSYLFIRGDKQDLDKFKKDFQLYDSIKDSNILANVYNMNGKLLETKKFSSRRELDNYTNSLKLYDMISEKEVYKNKNGDLATREVYKIVISDSVKDADKFTFKLSKKKNDYDEYVIKAYKNGKYYEDASYYTDDWDDAVGTIKNMASRQGLTVKQQGSDYVADSKVKDSKYIVHFKHKNGGDDKDIVVEAKGMTEAVEIAKTYVSDYYYKYVNVKPHYEDSIKDAQRFGITPLFKWNRGNKKPERTANSLEEARYIKSSCERADGIRYVIFDLETYRVFDSYKDYQSTKESFERIEEMPRNARKWVGETSDKKAGLLAIENGIEDIINAADPSIREELRRRGDKILRDIKIQFRVEDEETPYEEVTKKLEKNIEDAKKLYIIRWKDLFENNVYVTHVEASTMREAIEGLKKEVIKNGVGTDNVRVDQVQSKVGEDRKYHMIYGKIDDLLSKDINSFDSKCKDIFIKNKEGKYFFNKSGDKEYWYSNSLMATRYDTVEQAENVVQKFNLKNVEIIDSKKKTMDASKVYVVSWQDNLKYNYYKTNVNVSTMKEALEEIKKEAIKNGIDVSNVRVNQVESMDGEYHKYYTINGKIEELLSRNLSPSNLNFIAKRVKDAIKVINKFKKGK